MTLARALTSAADQAAIRVYAAGKVCLVEVGVAWGDTSRILRESMAADGVLHLVDPFLPTEVPGQRLTADINLARESVGLVPRGTVVWHVHTSEDAARGFTDAPDFVFIDGLHDRESVLLDWSLWSPLVRPGGAVLLHDVGPYCPGAWSAWQSIQHTPGWECMGVRGAVGIMARRP